MDWKQGDGLVELELERLCFSLTWGWETKGAASVYIGMGRVVLRGRRMIPGEMDACV